MQIRFTVTPAIVYQAQRAILREVKWMRWMGYVVVVGTPLILVALTLAYGGTVAGAIRSNWLLMLGFPLLWLVGLPLLQRWGAARTFRSTRTLQGDHVYTFASDGLTVATAVSTSHLAWGAIARVVETRDFVLLFQNQMVAMFIPKAAFEAPSQLQEWRALVAAQIGARAPWATEGALAPAT